MLILTDSRGHAVGTQLQTMNLGNCGVDIHIMPYSGGKIWDIAWKGFRDCHTYPYDRVYFMGGVNNLSLQRNGMSVPKYNNWGTLIRDIMQELYRARATIDGLAGEVIMCDLIGMNFQNYNYGLHSHAYLRQQHILDRAIVRINEYIQEMNEERGLKGPQLGDIVHQKRGLGRMEHKYFTTCHDGLHFNENTAVKIMDKIMANILY